MATRRTVTVSETVDVARDRVAVFDFTQDYAHRAEWDDSVVSAEVLSDEPLRVRLEIRSVGRMTLEYQLFRRGERTSAAFVDVDSSWVGGGGGSWAYESNGDGTHWTQTNTLELKHPRLMGFMAPMIERNLRSSMRRAMARAVAMMEGRAPTG
ncbi:MAG TPA: SRPBCC family protein [candidate division Zixibacteria bacterium]|nr:SRPBCC family protein [candidate division Zixibacteria bacterium]